MSFSKDKARERGEKEMTCPNCGSTHSYKVKRDWFKYYDVYDLICSDCGEVVQEQIED